jgi:hypothetical protein
VYECVIFPPRRVSLTEFASLVGGELGDSLVGIVAEDGREILSASTPKTAVDQEMIHENYAEQIDERYLDNAIFLRLWDVDAASKAIAKVASAHGHVISAAGTEVRRIDESTTREVLAAHLRSPSFHWFVEASEAR